MTLFNRAGAGQPVGRPARGAAGTVPAVAAVLTILLCALAVQRATAAPPMAGPGETVVWVRFADRGALEQASVAERSRVAREQLSARSLERRARRGGDPGLLDSDLPVEARYVERLAARGFRVRAVSRWLNAASVVAPVDRLPELRRLPFVAGVEPVPLTRVPSPEAQPEPPAGPVAPTAPGARAPAAFGAGSATSPLPGEPAFYGYSYAQNRIIQADSLHAQGLSGRGVLVTILDTGFKETHVAFESLEVVARRDFIHGDLVVANVPGEDSLTQADHGTGTLSVLAGNAPGLLVGTAFHAQVALAKTEWLPTETPAEMDYWQMGVEWADSLGADVVSSSLGYSVFDLPWPSYVYADMNGQTTVVTLAALEAARRGITVVTAQGNEGNKTWHYLIAPADADSVCSVGAVDSTNLIASFSSFGPTADGRVKPDVCAMGVRARMAWPTSDTQVVANNGTSFSTPATAGLVALLLEAHPTWGPFQVLQALRSTADRFATPDAHYGYGTARGAAAVTWVPNTGAPEGTRGAGGLTLLGPNPVAPPAGAVLRLRMGEAAGEAVVDVFDVRGRRVRNLLSRPLPAGCVRLVSWDGATDAGRRVPGGVYFVRFTAPGVRHSGRIVLFP